MQGVHHVLHSIQRTPQISQRSLMGCCENRSRSLLFFTSVCYPLLYVPYSIQRVQSLHSLPQNMFTTQILLLFDEFAVVVQYLCKVISDLTGLYFSVCVVTQSRERKDIRELTVSADEIVEVSFTQKAENIDYCSFNCYLTFIQLH